MPVTRRTVLISSTTLDLPEHRRQVVQACERSGMFPRVMENLPADPRDAALVSRRMVDEADIYLGIFAHRYGHWPAGRDLSITEMEYRRARERDLPCLIFLMHEDHPVRASDVERGAGAEKLDRLKEELKAAHVVNFFSSPEDLRGLVIQSLAELHLPDLTSFHRAIDVPRPPEPYIAHPYALLQTRHLIGREEDLSTLTGWVSDPAAEAFQARVLCVVAIGGMGKSALTWKWFNDVAPRVIEPLAGRLWWSFYESDASFDSFLTQALAYTSRRPGDEIAELSLPERAERLLARLDREPFLLVLDGLERLLAAYAITDNPNLGDEDLAESAGDLVIGMDRPASSDSRRPANTERLRRALDPGVGTFLRRLLGVRASRILTSTRLRPAELETATGQPRPGAFILPLEGLSREDALSLWQTFGVSGTSDALTALFDRFDRHPLLIQVLAGEVANYRQSPGDFDRWRADHPGFDPFALPLVQVKSHILAFAIQGLSGAERQVLRMIAAFRMPVTYDTLVALAVGADKPCETTAALDEILMKLEDRGLLGWDRRANRYDLHPIVRGVVWEALNQDARLSLYGDLQRHFEALPPPAGEVTRLEELTPAIGLYQTLIGLGRYDEAWALFQERLRRPLRNNLSTSRPQALLLEMLFPDGIERPPRIQEERQQAWATQNLAEAYLYGGQPWLTVRLCQRLLSQPGTSARLTTACLHDLSDSLGRCGKLRDAEWAASRSLLINREVRNPFGEAVSLGYLSYVLAARNQMEEACRAAERSLRQFHRLHRRRSVGVSHALLADFALWRGDGDAAAVHALQAWVLAKVQNYEQDLIRAARAQGSAALERGDLATADERLRFALNRARMVEFVDEELPALVALGELRRRQGDLAAARECLEDLWGPAGRGPYVLVTADALNLLARIERDAGNRETAIDHATEAFRRAWCDGPPYAYHSGLRAARQLIAELGGVEPRLPAFEESGRAPIPVLEIDPPQGGL